MSRYTRAAVFVLVVTLTPTFTSARADVTITFAQVGPDVDATATGTLNTTDLTIKTGTSAFEAEISPDTATVVMGSLTSGPNTLYEVISGPPGFGSSTITTPTTGMGDTFGIVGVLASITVPTGYVSGHLLSATDTYSKATFIGLGLTPGTYTWNWGTGANADSLTVQIGTAVVPEPSSAIVAVFGAVAFIAYGWSRHRRAQRQKAAA